MAVDSRDKRASAIGVLSPVPRHQQNPAGFIRHSGRHIAAFLYSGITIQQLSASFSGTFGVVRAISSAEANALS